MAKTDKKSRTIWEAGRQAGLHEAEERITKELLVWAHASDEMANWGDGDSHGNFIRNLVIPRISAALHSV